MLDQVYPCAGIPCLPGDARRVERGASAGTCRAQVPLGPTSRVRDYGAKALGGIDRGQHRGKRSGTIFDSLVVEPSIVQPSRLIAGAEAHG
jgi:hypothetical protein